MKLPRFFLPSTLTLLLAASAAWTTRLATRYQQQLQTQPATAARFEEQIQHLRGQRDTLQRRLAEARQQPSRATTTADAPTAPDATSDLTQATEVERWVRHTKRLKQAFERRPDQKIPELALLDDLDWLRAARRVMLDTEDDLDRALAILRNKAKDTFAQLLQKALAAYVKENHGLLPVEVVELRAYVDLTLDAALFAQYEMIGFGGRGDAPPGSILKLKYLVDKDYDTLISIQRRVDGSFTYCAGSKADPAGGPDRRSPEDQLDAQLEYDLALAVRAFTAKNRGTLPKSPAELIPYFDPPLGPALAETLNRPLTSEEQTKFSADIAKLAAGRRLPR